MERTVDETKPALIDEDTSDHIKNLTERLNVAVSNLRLSEARLRDAEAVVREAQLAVTEVKDEVAKFQEDARACMASLQSAVETALGDENEEENNIPVPLPKPRNTSLNGHTRQDRIILRLKMGIPLAVRAIADDLGEDYHDVYNTLQSMKERMYVEKTEDKLWRITGGGLELADQLEKGN